MVILIYLTGMSVYVSNRNEDKIISHKGVTPKDMRMSLLWPILLIFWLIKASIWILNDLLTFVLLIFNYNYKKSKIYKFVNKMDV
jgi:hypothetical protein